MRRPRHQARAMTPEEYLAFEARSKVKHEYVDGFVYAMSGTTRRHNRILFNVARHLGNVANGGPCEVVVNDLKVRADETKFYYPDVGVVCTPGDEEDLVILDPCLIVEVTSASTRSTDYREKLAAYRRIPTLGAYLIASHLGPLVDRYWRDDGGVWRHETVTPESGGRVPVPCPEAVLTLDEVYAGVTFRPRIRRVKERAPDFRPAPAGADAPA